MSLYTILLVHPDPDASGRPATWPHSQAWSYGPSGALGTVVVVLLILMLLGKL